eukprot:NODE_74_length_24438_cov_0.900283.p5 type:complete len:377 gc:universal NODE_74_length_24438_cov_0.900283:16767-15637(-)
MRLNVKLFCSTCNQPPVEVIEDFKQGDLICGICGLVLSEKLIDTRSEWRNFSDESSNPSRAGHAADPILGQNRQLDTVIADNGRGVNLQRIHIRTAANSLDKQLISGIQELEILGNQMSLTKSILDQSKENFRKVLEGAWAKGKDPTAVKAICILIASRQAGVNRSFKEISGICRVSKKELGRVFKLVNKPLTESTPNAQPNIQGVAAENLLSRFCSMLGLSQKIENIAFHIATRARQITSISSRSPLSVASGAILMACQISNENVSSKDVAEATGVSDSTTKSVLKILYANSDQVTKAEWKVVVPSDIEVVTDLTPESIQSSPSNSISGSGKNTYTGPALSQTISRKRLLLSSNSLMEAKKKKRKLINSSMLLKT